MLQPSMHNHNKCLGWRNKFKTCKLNLLGCKLQVEVVEVWQDGLPVGEEDNQVVCSEGVATIVVKLVTGGQTVRLESARGLLAMQPARMVQLLFLRVSSRMKMRNSK